MSMASNRFRIFTSALTFAALSPLLAQADPPADLWQTWQVPLFTEADRLCKQLSRPDLQDARGTKNIFRDFTIPDWKPLDKSRVQPMVIALLADDLRMIENPKIRPPRNRSAAALARYGRYATSPDTSLEESVVSNGPNPLFLYRISLPRAIGCYSACKDPAHIVTSIMASYYKSSDPSVYHRIGLPDELIEPIFKGNLLYFFSPKDRSISLISNPDRNSLQEGPVCWKGHY